MAWKSGQHSSLDEVCVSRARVSNLTVCVSPKTPKDRVVLVVVRPHLRQAYTTTPYGLVVIPHTARCAVLSAQCSVLSAQVISDDQNSPSPSASGVSSSSAGPSPPPLSPLAPPPPACAPLAHPKTRIRVSCASCTSLNFVAAAWSGLGVRARARVGVRARARVGVGVGAVARSTQVSPEAARRVCRPAAAPAAAQY